MKTEKRKITTFDEALEKVGIKLSGITEKIKEHLIKKWEKGEPIYIMDKKLDIPGKEDIIEEIKCDINRIGEVKGYIEDISMLENTKEIMNVNKYKNRIITVKRSSVLDCSDIQ